MHLSPLTTRIPAARGNSPSLGEPSREAMHSAPPLEPAAFSGFIDLAAARLGGVALIANDEFFAEKDNLLKAERPVFDAARYTDRGKWMDGWETRRRRTPGHDWCIVRLGLPGRVHGFDID